MSANPAVRKLTTILAADVVGYGKLMAADEEGTVATLRAYREIVVALLWATSWARTATSSATA